MLLFWSGLAWLAGIAAGAIVRQSALAWLLLAGLTFALTLYYRHDPMLRLPLVCAVLFSLGGARYQLHLPDFDERFVSTYNDLGEVAIEGVVVDEPDVRDTYTNLRLRADLLLLPDGETAIPTEGPVLVRAPRYPAYGYGDLLRVSGPLETPPEFEDFSYADYLARQGVYSLMRHADVAFIADRQANPLLQWIFDFKARALGVLEQIFPQPHAALMQGILLGVESGIPTDLKESFSATGTSHIVAISGFNITIIAGLFAFAANRLFGRRRGLWVAVAGIAFYTFLVGADAAVVRAAIMGGLALLARRVGRQVDGLNALMAAAILMTAFNPLTLWDVGFQLSFFATLGLILYVEPFTGAFIRLVARFTTPEWAERAAGLASDVFLMTLAAQITTLPLIAYYFRRVSLISFLANLLIIPAQPAVMILSGVAMMGGLLWLPLGQALSWIAFPFVAYTIGFVETFARIPGATLYLGRAPGPFLALTYGALFGVTWLIQRRERTPETDRKFRVPTWARDAALVGLAILAILAWHTTFRGPDGNLHVTVLDVGQGDGVLIETPTGRRVLIDGGPRASTLSSALGRRLPLFDRQLDWLVIAASQDEHVGGLAGVMGQFRVGNALVAGKPARTGAYRALMETLARMGIPVESAQTGQALNLGAGARLEVVSAGGSGGVFRVVWQRASFLLPIGLDGETVEGLLAEGRLIPAHGLLLARHGDVALNSEELLAAVNPGLAVISLGADAPPSPSVLRRLESRTVLRTDRDGWIEWVTDGERVWVRTEK